MDQKPHRLEASASHRLYKRILKVVTFGERLRGALFVLVWTGMLLAVGKVGWHIRSRRRNPKPRLSGEEA